MKISEILFQSIKIIETIVEKVDFSIVIAWIGAIIALSSARSTKKQLKLLKDQDERRQPNLKVHIGQAVNVYNNDTSGLDYIFDLMVKNNTDIDNSVTRVQLLIKYSFNNDNLFHVADYNRVKRINDSIITTDLPINIGANNSKRIWCIFSFPHDWIMKISIIDYTVRLYDTHDNTYIDNSIVVKGEMRYEDVQ